MTVDVPIVDAHMHVYPAPVWARQRTRDHPITEYGEGSPIGTSTAPGDVASAIDALDRVGADVGLALNLFEPTRVEQDLATLPPLASITPDATVGQYLMWLNVWLCEAVGETSRLRPVVAVDPGAVSERDLALHLEQVSATGAVGVKLHHAFQRVPPDDPRLEPVYAACVDLELPIVAHSGDTVPPSAFADVIRRWPRLTLVLAHLGGAAWHEAGALAREHPRVMFDLAEILWWVGSPKAPQTHDLAGLIRAIGAERVLFGSDFPWYEPEAGVRMVRALGLTATDEAAVLGGNAARVFMLRAEHGPEKEERT